MVRALVAVLAPLVARIAKLSALIRHTVAQMEDGRILMSFPRAGQICAAAILAELGEDRSRYLTPDQLAADGGLAPSPGSPGSPAASASDGPATAACAPHSPASPTTPATPRPGPPISTPERAAEDAGIRMRSASSAAHGFAFSGAPGSIASLTTQASTAPQPPWVDTGCLMRPEAAARWAPALAFAALAVWGTQRLRSGLVLPAMLAADFCSSIWRSRSPASARRAPWSGE